MTESKAIELSKWREQVLKDLDDARQQLAELQKRIREGEQRLELVNGLLTLETSGNLGPQEAKPATSGDELLDACEQITRDTGRPMHISELHSALLARGVPLPGRGAEANLIVRLQRSNGRFLRVGRGIYAPAKLGLAEVKPTRTRRRARKRN